ncbi:vWA domain-containing protein [Streptomyces sp. NPDC006477]|uniref:vWA domain-containing protein n=1 Tax=Streptomyces sp. NPDC006477 TaxID=3364747 RepID=UPI00367717E2
MAKVVTDPKVAKEDKRRARLGALAVTLTKTDRILTGRDDVVMTFNIDGPGLWSPMKNVPAWNDGKRITLNAPKLPSIESASGLITCLGLNHHEVAHILFSLGNHTPFIEHIRDMGWFLTYNMLEDARIETLLSGQYISARKYLTAPVLHFIVEDEEAWPTAHLLTYGRRYLPLDVRREFAKRFVGTKVQRKEAERIIDAYRVLDLSDVSKHQTAQKLVKEMHDLLQILIPSLPQPQQDSFGSHKGCGGVDTFTNDRAKVAKAEKEASRRDDEDDDEDEQPWDDDGSMDDDSGDDESSDPSESSSGRGKGDPDGDDAGASGSGGTSDQDDDGSDPAGSQGGGNGSSQGGEDQDGEGNGLDVDESTPSGGGSGSSKETVKNLAKAALDAIEESPDVQDEITRLQNAMNDSNNVDAVLPKAKFRELPPSVDAASASALTVREFQNLRTKFEPGWEFGTDHGRVNIARAMTADFGDTDIYDSWDEGREEDSALECVILLDSSGSMGNMMASASEAAWVVKRGVDEVDGLSTIITFDGYTNKLFSRSERANPSAVRHVADMGGSTRPEQGMREARIIFGQSERPNKLFVLITDGGFMGADEMYRPLLESISATRVYIGINETSSPGLADCYDAHAKVTHPSQIAPIIRAAVTSMLDEAWKRR